MTPEPIDAVLERERAYHDRLYSGFAQQHFARPAVRALREHLVRRILRQSGAGPRTRVLSLGCGIGDTEILLAPHVGSVAGIDLSSRAVEQARVDARRAGAANADFRQVPLDAIEDRFDLVIAIFFLHHLPQALLEAAPAQIRKCMVPGGTFYSLDPSRWRLSGAVGSLVAPGLMRRYQTPDERELGPRSTAVLFRQAGFDAHLSYYDFTSTPIAGLFPSWRAGYRAARRVDDVLVRIPLVRGLGSNFEILAQVVE